ncbi:MAG: pyridoxamine 5'-phosphate oxidase family protein, partial [Lachnospiraceae bacterium]|nr:pyridoxamine 5'-phosphate oxidase family protein [Lachnospiraceae bacterium]
MQRVYDFLKKAGTYYLATMDGEQPRIRPFGTVDLFEGRIYIQTGKSKSVSKQMQINPKIEICAMDEDKWIRVEATVCFLQALFGEKCKIFLENAASPNWRKLQSLGWQLLGQPHDHCRQYLIV